MTCIIKVWLFLFTFCFHTESIFVKHTMFMYVIFVNYKLCMIYSYIVFLNVLLFLE